MIGLLASPLFRYGIALVGAVAMLGGLYGYGHHQGAVAERAKWETAIQHQKDEAAKLIADRIAENNALEEKSEALNAKLEQDHATAAAEIASAHDDYNRAIADRVRIARSGVGSCPARTPETTNPDSRENVAAAGIFVSRATLENLGNLAAEADELVTAMTACKAWAVEHGR